ncbi:thiol-disulfide oxidoreductase DCC family protein [Altererythrobacter sp.]|uniref:thiol-disulfide oxidoreductase DCC family protein n=1 Tax=Altererythrobacter sp. TaxID=1872480 RepID=UPI003D108901
MTHEPFSYRDDANVPEFDDSGPLFVFDNICALCSGGSAFLMRRASASHIRFTSAQGTLGQALYGHYGIELDESYLFLRDGRAFIKDEGYFQLAQELGGLWRLVAIFRLVPAPLRRAAYNMIARNRYRWFGKVPACSLLTEEQKSRLL